MPELRLAELAAAAGGRLLRGDPELRVRSFGIDSRTVEPGGVFFALRGERADGHRFVPDAAARGAAAAVVQETAADEGAAPVALVLVEDTTRALAACGSWVRRHLTGKTWIAITGSNGKTTTKELLAAGLAARVRVHRTPGNLNNHLGVPLTLLGCPDDAQAVVVEMGMNAYGEIAALTAIADPDVGLVTNVRAAHLGAFGSLDDIAAAKGELFAGLRDEATAVVNLDDPLVRIQAQRHVGPQVTFGQHAAADLRMEEIENRFLPGAAFVFRRGDSTRRVRLRLPGAHAAFDALAALAAIWAVRGDLEAASEAMERVEAGTGRGRAYRIRDDILVIDDSYNSSPAALASVLETLRLSEPAGRRVLVMGDMLELGRVEGALHREAGKRAASAGVALFVGVGQLSRGAADSARRSGVPEVYHFADSSRAAEDIAELLRPGDVVVVKGSRSMRMERVVEALTGRPQGEVH